MRSLHVSLALIPLLSLLAAAHSARADNTVQATSDTWISDRVSGIDETNTNFEGSVNPSAQLRNDGTVRRISLYQFTLPAVGAYETVTGAEFRLEEFFAGSSFKADFGLLSNNPNMTTITYNSAIADNYVDAGNDANQNPVIDPSTTLAGEVWTVANGTGTLKFVDNNAANGFAQLIKNAAGVTPQTRTIMITPVDTAASATVAAFYGEDNSEGLGFYPDPRLTLRKQLTTVTHEIVADADVWIASNSPGSNFEGNVNPATQLRNDSSVTRASLYRFTLPQLGANQSIEGVQFDLIEFDDGGYFSADFALLASNPDLSTITWNSAIVDGFITGVDGSFNPTLGANATAAGEFWQRFGNQTDSIRFTDGDASNGLAQLIAGAASTAGPVDITLLLFTQGGGNLVFADFFGTENTDNQGDFFAHPRLRLTVVTIPEPASVSLMGLAAVSLMWLRRRR